MTIGIDPRNTLHGNVAAIVAAECVRAGRILHGRARPKAVHEVRKKLKRLRAALRLVRSGDEDFCRAENTRYRDVAKSLSAARDAGASVETVDRFMKRAGEEAEELPSIRAGLVRRRDATMRLAADAQALGEAAREALAAGAAAVARARFPESPDAMALVLSAGVGRNLRQARRSLKRARKRGRAEDFHELRKAIKDHWIQMDLLRAVWPGNVGKRRAAAKALGDDLGELNDIAVLLGQLDGDGGEIAPKQKVAVFRRRLKRRDRELRRSCLAEAGILLDLKPRTLAEQVRKRCLKKALAQPVGESAVVAVPDGESSSEAA